MLEAICGALFIDSNKDLSIVQKKIVDKFYNDLKGIIDESSLFNKNMLLEFLQKKFRTTIFIKADFENIGSDDNPQWVAKNPKIFDMSNNTEIIKQERK